MFMPGLSFLVLKLKIKNDDFENILQLKPEKPGVSLGWFPMTLCLLLPAPCVDLEPGSHFCFWKGKETDIMNGFYCAIFQALLNAFEWDGNRSALCHSQNKHDRFPKPGRAFLSNWQQSSTLRTRIWFDNF